MRTLLFLLIVLAFTGCENKSKSEKADFFYYYDSRTSDTSLTLNPTIVENMFDTLLVVLFNDESFSGQVTKMRNKNAPVDGEAFYYATPDFGIIFRSNTTWANYGRLHSTNDSIERRISDYIDHILSRPDLIKAGLVQVVFR